VNQQTALVIDGQAERPSHARHALGAKVLLGLGEQPRENLMIVDRVDEAEEAAAVVELGEMRAIDGGDDSSDRLAVAKCDERSNGVLAREWRPPRIEQHARLFMDRLDPMRIDGLSPSARRYESGDPRPVERG
jgi:hypothetical protein